MDADSTSATESSKVLLHFYRICRKRDKVKIPEIKTKDIDPKPIMVLEIDDVVRLTAKLEAQCDQTFSAKISGRWLKITRDTYAMKTKISNYLKEQQYQFYIVFNLEAPLKVVLRGLPKRTISEKIIKEFKEKGFVVSQATQMRSRKCGRKIPTFRLQLPLN